MNQVSAQQSCHCATP